MDTAAHAETDASTNSSKYVMRGRPRKELDVEELRQRFLAKTWGTAPLTCLFWTASTMTAGYGKMQADGKLRQATHVAFFLKHGRWPKSRLLRHTCDIRRCVLADHLLEGTHKDNHDDMKSRGRSACGERHGMAKLSNEQADEIRRAEGRCEDIGYWYEISGAQVARIRRGTSRGQA